MVICLELGADLHMAHLMPLPLTVSCFSKIQIGFTSLVPAHLGSHGQRAVKQVCVCARTHILVVNPVFSMRSCNPGGIPDPGITKSSILNPRIGKPGLGLQSLMCTVCG